MSADLQPFGLRPIANLVGSLPSPRFFQLTSGYGTNLYTGTPVKLNTNGTIVISGAAEDFLGCFDSVEYQPDINGAVIKDNKWIAGTVGVNIKVFVHCDPSTMFEIQSTGSIPLTGVGDGADFTNITAGSIVTGTSGATLNPTLVGAGNPAQFRILGAGQAIGNNFGDSFTVVTGLIGRSQLTANKNVI